jgi:nitrate/TMAO reductase-like tetraheme cytochrome c subunit
MTLAMAVVAALVIGFMAGLFSFKKKSTWCEACGETKQCVACTDRRRTLAVHHDANTGRF